MRTRCDISRTVAHPKNVALSYIRRWENQRRLSGLALSLSSSSSLHNFCLFSLFVSTPSCCRNYSRKYCSWCHVFRTCPRTLRKRLLSICLRSSVQYSTPPSTQSSSTSTPVATASRKRSSTRVQNSSLCDTRCLSILRRQTRSSKPSSVRRLRRVRVSLIFEDNASETRKLRRISFRRLKTCLKLFPWLLIAAHKYIPRCSTSRK